MRMRIRYYVLNISDLHRVPDLHPTLETFLTLRINILLEHTRLIAAAMLLYQQLRFI